MSIFRMWRQLKMVQTKTNTQWTVPHGKHTKTSLYIGSCVLLFNTWHVTYLFTFFHLYRGRVSKLSHPSSFQTCYTYWICSLRTNTHLHTKQKQSWKFWTWSLNGAKQFVRARSSSLKRISQLSFRPVFTQKSLCWNKNVWTDIKLTCLQTIESCSVWCAHFSYNWSKSLHRSLWDPSQVKPGWAILGF